MELYQSKNIIVLFLAKNISIASYSTLKTVTIHVANLLYL